MFIKQRRFLPRVFTFIATCICMIVVCGILAIGIIEWMAGCGETYVDANNVRHQYECVFLTVHNEGVKK
jgi:hypothetical protein